MKSILWKLFLVLLWIKNLYLVSLNTKLKAKVVSLLIRNQIKNTLILIQEKNIGLAYIIYMFDKENLNLRLCFANKVFTGHNINVVIINNPSLISK